MTAADAYRKTKPRGKGKGIILFHGAGGDRDHHTFLRLEHDLPIPVARINFPYRQKGPGRRPPDRMPKLIDAVNDAVDHYAAQWRVRRTSIVVGGRSMGGRAASMALADGMKAAGLVLLSYPLHPPGKPEKLRVDHLDQITFPTLLVQGVRDPFGTPAEFAEHLPLIRGPLTEHWINANHSPKESLDDDIVGFVRTWLKAL
jgi:predicted alpha/beta-hydrolase family hydrolase